MIQNEETLLRGSNMESSAKETQQPKEQLHEDAESVHEVKENDSNDSWKYVTMGGASAVLLGAGALYATDVFGSEELDGDVSVVGVAHAAGSGTSFGDAFAAARDEVGAGGVFEWHGHLYNTYTHEEWDKLTPEQRDDFVHDALQQYGENHHPIHVNAHMDDPIDPVDPIDPHDPVDPIDPIAGHHHDPIDPHDPGEDPFGDPNDPGNGPYDDPGEDPVNVVNLPSGEEALVTHVHVGDTDYELWDVDGDGSPDYSVDMASHDVVDLHSGESMNHDDASEELGAYYDMGRVDELDDQQFITLVNKVADEQSYIEAHTVDETDHHDGVDDEGDYVSDEDHHDGIYLVSDDHGDVAHDDFHDDFGHDDYVHDDHHDDFGHDVYAHDDHHDDFGHDDYAHDDLHDDFGHDDYAHDDHHDDFGHDDYAHDDHHDDFGHDDYAHDDHHDDFGHDDYAHDDHHDDFGHDDYAHDDHHDDFDTLV